MFYIACHQNNKTKDPQYGIFTYWNDTYHFQYHQKGAYARKTETLEEAKTLLAQHITQKYPSYTFSPENCPVHMTRVVPLKAAPKYTHIYTDGHCQHNGTDRAQASAGVYLEHKENPQFIVCPLPGTHHTNNAAELLGILLAIIGANEEQPVSIYTDSQYSIDSAKSMHIPDANRHLIGLIRYALTLKPNVSLQKVEGHSNLPGNDIAHHLANHGTKLHLETFMNDNRKCKKAKNA